jgi:serine/threonine-protein kinase
VTYHSIGKLPQAIEGLEKVRAARMRKLGVDHPDTLSTQHALGRAYYAAGKLPLAIEYYEYLRAARTRKFGADHPDTLMTLSDLALAYQHAAKLPQAIELFKTVRAGQMKKLGADHPHTLTTTNDLAKAIQESGKLELALPLFQQAALGIEKQKFRHEHARLVFPNLIACHEQLQQYAEAEIWQRKWLAVVKRSEPPSPYAVELAALGSNLLRQEKWTEAEGVLRECLAIREKFVNSPVVYIPAKPRVFTWHVADVKSLLGAACAGQKNYADAEPLLLAGATGLLDNEKSVPLTAKRSITDAVQRLIALYDATGKKDDAEKWRIRLAARDKAKGPADP